MLRLSTNCRGLMYHPHSTVSGRPSFVLAGVLFTSVILAACHSYPDTPDGLVQHATAVVSDNPARAVNLLEAAAEQDHAEAMVMLGTYYESGSLNKRPLELREAVDGTRAEYWYGRAIDLMESQVAAGDGNPLNLAIHYASGRGMPRDLDRACELAVLDIRREHRARAAYWLYRWCSPERFDAVVAGGEATNEAWAFNARAIEVLMDEEGTDVVRYVSLLRSASQAGDAHADDSILELQNAIAIRAENGGSEAAESITKLRAAGLWVLD